MKRKVAIVAMFLLVAAFAAAPLFAKVLTGSGKVLAVDKDRVTLQLSKGQGASFPVGTRGVDIKTADGATARGRVVSATGDKVIFRIMRGKASSLPVGANVQLEQAVKPGSEELQGC